MDIRKAFDTLSHPFIDQVLDFFEFGDNFKKWVKILCTNRKACIVLEGGKTSRTFNLLRGNAQGDILSPFIFILCYQILIFKIQFDLQILGFVSSPVTDSNSTINRLPAEVSDTPTKITAMADDTNCLLLLEEGTLKQVKLVLEQFGKISGLCCNIEKTVLIPVGRVEPIPQNLLELGFEFKNRAIILGMEISNNLNNFDNAANTIINKVRAEINKWYRFRLSLPGRIAVTKSLVYSQLNYLGSFLPVTSEQLKKMVEPIENFISGNLNIAKARIYAKIENGGWA